MSKKIPELIEHFGFRCPKGGKAYICEGSWKESIGCCISDPCTLIHSGQCPQKDIRGIEFKPENEGLLFDSISCEHGCCFSDGTSDACNNSEPAMLQMDEKARSAFFNAATGKLPDSGNETFFSHSPPPPIFSMVPGNASGTAGLGSIAPSNVAGLSTGVAILILLLFAFIWHYLWKPRSTTGFRAASGQIYVPVITSPPIRNNHGMPRNDPVPKAPLEDPNPESLWYFDAHQSSTKDFGSFFEWIWDSILTFLPLLFIALTVLILALGGQPISDTGQRILNLSKLGPTIYPILFAAISSRFYKNISRWRLEQQNGILIGTLEQLFGSQNLAGAFERLILVRTQIPIGFLILFIWGMSPLGGQGSSRMLTIGQSISNGTIYYLHPSYQISTYNIYTWANSMYTNINSLYALSITGSETQRHSSRDQWGLPKIPQWVNSSSGVNDIDQAALERGELHYISLLGIKVQGFEDTQKITHHSFSVETSYLDLRCRRISLPMRHNSDHDGNPTYRFNDQLNITNAFGSKSSFAANISRPIYAKNTIPKPYLLYVSQGPKYQDYSEGGDFYIIFNCTISPMVVETELECGPTPSTTSCSAQRQRLANSPAAANRLLNQIMNMQTQALNNFFEKWSMAVGYDSKYKSSPTDNYLSGKSNAFAVQAWGDIVERSLNDTLISRRLTTLFNTFWMASLDPLGYSNISFTNIPKTNTVPSLTPNSQPFLNTTKAHIKIDKNSYHVNKFWVVVVLIATFILELLAIIGFTLRFFIHGPDILGFASSITRDNPYIPLPEGGSNLNGPERARLLSGLRVQLADVRPREGIGYITIRALMSKNERGDGKDEAIPHSFPKNRAYI